jgi:hypothetical protein
VSATPERHRWTENNETMQKQSTSSARADECAGGSMRRWSQQKRVTIAPETSVRSRERCAGSLNRWRRLLGRESENVGSAGRDGVRGVRNEPAERNEHELALVRRSGRSQRSGGNDSAVVMVLFGVRATLECRNGTRGAGADLMGAHVSKLAVLRAGFVWSQRLMERGETMVSRDEKSRKSSHQTQKRECQRPAWAAEALHGGSGARAERRRNVSWLIRCGWLDKRRSANGESSSSRPLLMTA